MYGVILEKGHTTLPISELAAVTSLSGAKIVETHGELAIVDRKFDWNRLALTKEVFLIQKPEKVRPRKSFAVRIHGNSSKSRQVARKIKGKVDLKNPHTVYSGIVKNHELFFGRRMFLRESFESRKVQNRPFFHPTSLHPKLARVLVNLARVKKGQKLLDPFCGTGGILIEAALCGLKPIGIDVDSQMAWGAKDNLAFYHLDAKVQQGDARRTRIKAQGIATDPPYGRASYFSGAALGQLYREALFNFDACLPKKGFVSMIAPSQIKVEKFASETGFLLCEKHYQRVHKSLSRFFYVLQKT